MKLYYQGKFLPKNPKKYIGDVGNIVYRSQWEFAFMRLLDSHPDVLKWGSEELIIPYKSPLDGKIHRYFTDFIVHQINANREVETVVVEIKPYNQTIEPATSTKKTKKFINEVKTWATNSAKWEAASAYCAAKGWKFKVLTEYDLGIKKRK